MAEYTRTPVAPVGRHIAPLMFGEIPNSFVTLPVGDFQSDDSFLSTPILPETPTPTNLHGLYQGSGLTLQNASHHALLGAGNKAYADLWEENLKHKAKAEAIQTAYNSLVVRVQAIPDSQGHADAPRPQHQRKDYSQVTIWYASEWANHPKNKRSDAAGFRQPGQSRKRGQDAVRDSLFYIQDQTGTSITERKASDLAFFARQVWEEMHSKNMAPQTWGRCTVAGRQYYLKEMYKFCPELAFCDGDWKADRFATDTYTGWMRGRFESEKKVKVKEEQRVKQEGEGEMMVEGTKRKEAPSTNIPIKAAKAAKLATSSIPNTVTPLDESGSVSVQVESSSPPYIPVIDPALRADSINLSPLPANAINQEDDTSTPKIVNLSAQVVNLDVVTTPLPPPSTEAPTPVNEHDIAIQSTTTTLHLPSDAFKSQSSVTDSDNHQLLADALVPSSAMDSGEDVNPTATSSVKNTITDATLQPFKLNLVDPFGNIKKADGVSRVAALNATDSSGTAGAALTKEGPVAISKKDLFKYQRASCSALNLFGKEYLAIHGPSSKDAVTSAFQALSPQDREVWEARRKAELAGRKTETKRRGRNAKSDCVDASVVAAAERASDEGKLD